MKQQIFTLIFSCSSICSFNAAAQTNTIETGEQAVITDATGSRTFVGNTLDFNGFSGVLGMSSDTAYVITAAGEARLGNLKAKPGDVLILTPYGGEPVKQLFDAERYLATWETSPSGADKAAMDKVVLAGLERVKKKQARAKFFGLYQPTNFNVAAPGSRDSELARRSIVGSEVIQNIRFSNETDLVAIERQIISAFRDALIEGDAETVASLMDPSPYGGSDLRGGADGARLLRAKQLIKSKNWGRLLRGSEIERAANGELWAVASGANRIDIQMRPLGDFTYISSIEQGT